MPAAIGVARADDVEVIELELAMSDLESVQERLDNVRAKMKAGRTKELEKEEGALAKIVVVLEAAGTNPKMSKLQRMVEQASNEVLVISDADIADEVTKFERWRATLRVVPAIVALRERAEIGSFAR